MKPPNVQSPFARVRHYPNTEGSNFYPLRGHYASIIARTDSFADPCGSSSFSLTWIIHEQTLILKKAAILGALARGVYEAFDTLSFLIEAQNMVQVSVLAGFYAS